MPCAACKKRLRLRPSNLMRLADQVLARLHIKMPPATSTTLFPYTTLFRSRVGVGADRPAAPDRIARRRAVSVEVLELRPRNGAGRVVGEVAAAVGEIGRAHV